jgi:hypothetical protein
MLSRTKTKIVDDKRLPKFPFIYQKIKAEELEMMEQNYQLKLQKMKQDI